jgi:hypothetical protein
MSLPIDCVCGHYEVCHYNSDKGRTNCAFCNCKKFTPDNPIPARSAAECIDRLRLANEKLREVLAKIMYWMDRAREGQEIDLDKFNNAYNECNDALANDDDADPAKDGTK